MAYSAGLDVRVTDTTLRDGSHAVEHRFTTSEVERVVHALDEAGVPVIEVSHGDGLGGSSFTYGFSRVDERVLIQAAVTAAKKAKIAVLHLPGVGTMDDIRAASDLGASVIRIATHCTEADIGIQHFGLARDLGMETVGFLMMAHSQPPEKLTKQARIMADAGSECVYVTDSAGALILDQAAERVAALTAELGADAQVGFHGHENLGLGVANNVLAIRAGALQVDGCTRGLGAGAGNTPTEVLAAVLDKLGVRTGINTLAVINAAEDVVRPLMETECVTDRMSILMGYAGVYSSFLRHAERIAKRYDVPGADIIMRAGQRNLVGGQEDQLVGIAVGLADEAVQQGKQDKRPERT
jgi:4-hydroxy 2-oxovalerate aldolase